MDSSRCVELLKAFWVAGATPHRRLTKVRSGHNPFCTVPHLILKPCQYASGSSNHTSTY